MTDLDPTVATATELGAAIAARQVSSRELLEALLARVDEANPVLNAVVTVDVDRARARAHQADEATARGESWGPLHGLPITVKDVWETEGLRTTSGAPELRDHVPAADAVAVARLKRAGAVVFAKTNTPLYAGDIQTYNELFGRTANPWDPQRTAGGSSGGAAAAVAAGISPLELGSDIGGSIRIPSHCCGTFGLKPSWGLVPSRGHIPGPPGSLLETDVNSGGPMARSVEDLTLGLEVLAGPLAEDAVAWRLELPAAPARDGVRGLRIAVCDDDDRHPVGAEVRGVIGRLADQLADAGAAVERRPLPVPPREAARTWTHLVVSIIGAGLPEASYREFAAAAAGLSDDEAHDSVRALAASFRDRSAWDQRRAEQRRRWSEHFETWDVTLAPVLPVPAFPHDHDDPFPLRTLDVDGRTVPHLDLTAWCGSVGVMLLPVVAVPAGLGPSGLPVGVQVIGPWLQDRATLAAAAAISEVAGGFRPPPVG